MSNDAERRMNERRISWSIGDVAARPQMISERTCSVPIRMPFRTDPSLQLEEAANQLYRRSPLKMSNSLLLFFFSKKWSSSISQFKKMQLREKRAAQLSWSALNVWNKAQTSLSGKCLHLRKPAPIKYLDFLF